MNKTSKLVIGLIVGVVILGAAAFVGAKLITKKTNGLSSGFNLGGSTISSTSLDVEPSPFLPKTKPSVYGTLSERKDNSILIQTVSLDASNDGSIAVAAVPNEDVESGDVVTDFVGEQGPIVEVVTTKDSKIFKDVTEFHFNSKETTKQELETGSLDELSKTSIITVWGRKVGDRIIADVIVIYNPSYVNVP